MTDYVLGFAFTADLGRVLLVRKKRAPRNKPDMVGLLNGCGGKLEQKDYGRANIERRPDSLCAMEREAKEETDLDLNWTYYCKLEIGSEARVFCFYAVDNEVVRFRQMEDEELGLYDVNQVYAYPELHDRWFAFRPYVNEPHMPNLEWLIPMALNHYKKLDSAMSFTVQEHV